MKDFWINFANDLHPGGTLLVYWLNVLYQTPIFPGDWPKYANSAKNSVMQLRRDNIIPISDGNCFIYVLSNTELTESKILMSRELIFSTRQRY
jgi:hypothetical protein